MVFNGLLLVNKPSGITSHDLVDQARRIFRTKEVGHSGTLDPMASGLMVLLLGQATKLSPYVMEGDKSYSVEVLLGEKTDTLDVTGQVLQTAPVTDEQISKIPSAIATLTGEFQWPVPIYSAVKVQGQKLYERARDQSIGEIQIPVKPMKFWNVKLKSEPGVRFWVELDCSKGTFVRSWVEQLGELLGCGATMKSLVRTGSSPYRLEQAKTLEETKTLLTAETSLDHFIPMGQALPHLRKVRVQSFDQTLLLNGQISHDLRRQLIGAVDPEESCILQVLPLRDDTLLALIAYEKGRSFKIKRVFPQVN